MAPVSTPDQFPSKDMFDSTIDVIVGDGPGVKAFKLHKGVLAFYSGFFDRKFKAKSSRARNGAIKMPSEDSTTFERFVLWLYTRKLDSVTESDSFTPLCKLWALGDRREIPLLMNSCIDALQESIVSKWKVPTSNLAFIYDNTRPESGLRRFAIYVISLACNTTSCESDKDRSRWPYDALWDMMKLTWDRDNTRKLDKQGVAEIDTCQFHLHEAGVICLKNGIARSIEG